MAEETFPLQRRAIVSAGCANVIYDEEITNPDGTAYDFSGYVFEAEINTLPDGGGTKLADVTITVAANRITGRIDLAGSNAVVAGAPNKQAYCDILFAASALDEPEKWATITLPTSGTVTVWGAEVPV